ncbi:PAS domain-containing protein [Methylobacterium organophilum]|uniref:PAS domain-containing protein n=1 Tax=Methylobacterium organophilum TaxID=410 RepID=UPI0035710835
MEHGADHGPRAAAGLAAPSAHAAAFAGARIGLAVVTADGATLRDANPQLCSLLGYPPGALAGRPFAEIFGAQDSLPRSGIRRCRRADGGAIDLRLRMSQAGPGAEIVLVAEAVDPDELVHSEQNREALVAAGLGEWRWDAANGTFALSRRAAQIFGYPPGHSVDGETLRDRILLEDRERVRAEIAAATRERRPYRIETRFRRGGDDSVIWIGVRGQAIFSAEDSLTGMVGVVQDLSTRMEVQDALRAREQRLRVATSLAALGIFEWHLLDDRAIWENDRMFEIFGRSPDEGAVGKVEFLSSILHPEDRKPFRQAISRALREDAILYASGRVRRGGDGHWRHIEMAGRFERDAPDRLPRRLIGVVADVTERKLAEERQTLLIRELHHRVKNTLATVQAIVGSTARTATSIESFYEAFVGRIKSLAHTHSVLTEDTWQTASLNGLLENELRPYAESAGAGLPDTRVSLDGPPVDLPSEIAVPIGMAIHELTTNAVKYGALSTPAGRVAVRWSLAEGGPAGTLLFEWSESGGPKVAPPSRQGFGSRLLQRVLTAQVQAEIETTYEPQGFRLSMRAPLPVRNAALNPLV